MMAFVGALSSALFSISIASATSAANSSMMASVRDLSCFASLAILVMGSGALILLAPLRLGGYCHYRSAAPVGVRQAWAQAQAQAQALGAEAALSNEPTLISVSSQ